MNVIKLYKEGRKFKTLNSEVAILDTDFHVSQGSFILFKLCGPTKSIETLVLCNNWGQAFTVAGLSRRPELDLILITETVTKYAIIELVEPINGVIDRNITNVNLLSLLYSSRDSVVSMCASNTALDAGIIVKIEWEQ